MSKEDLIEQEIRQYHKMWFAEYVAKTLEIEHRINGENTFVIKVFAENESTKDYKLIITKQKTDGKVTIKKFVLGAGEVEFKNNKATIEKLTNETKLDYSYELSDSNATLKVYLNDKETKKLNELKENDKI